MDGFRVHFEVHVRKTPGDAWKLDAATEDRGVATASAKAIMDEGRAVAVKVTKETLDEATGEFRSVSILNLGDPNSGRKQAPVAEPEPLCITPQDLYTVHARERIGRLLEEWLERNSATAFELLHRPDLVEQLEASGIELQHALQKIAIPEAQTRGMSVHELIRTFQALVERAVERLMRDAKRGVLPNIDKEGFRTACERVAKDPERIYLLGAGVAASIAPARDWTDKINRLLDLADAAPAEGPGRALALSVIEQPLAEILGSKVGFETILGKGLDLGGLLAAMTRLAAVDAVTMLVRVEPSVAKVMPALSEGAQRLAGWLGQEEFADVRAALGRRIIRELNGPRRLRPTDAASEIDLLRALAMALTAASGKLLPIDDVQSAFSYRSRMIVNGEFVGAYLGKDKTAKEEAEALIWLTENVIGPVNKRAAGRWLHGAVTSLRFEKEMRYGPDSAATRLAALAGLQRAAGRCGLVEEDFRPIRERLGEMGGLVEADVKLTTSVARAGGSAVHRLTLLLRLATGEAAPLGPAADRARAEALKLARQDDTRAELAKAPEQVVAVRDLIQQAGLAA